VHGELSTPRRAALPAIAAVTTTPNDESSVSKPKIAMGPFA